MLSTYRLRSSARRGAMGWWRASARTCSRRWKTASSRTLIFCRNRPASNYDSTGPPSDSSLYAPMLRPTCAVPWTARLGLCTLVIVDDSSIYRTNTSPVRSLLRNFVQRHLGPNDQAALVSTGMSRVFQDFTADRNLLLAAASRVFGDSAGSPTVQALTSIEHKSLTSPIDGPREAEGTTPHPPAEPAGRPARYSRGIRPHDADHARRGSSRDGSVGARSRAILFVTEGSPIQSVTALEGLHFLQSIDRRCHTARSSVPIFPIDPRGLRRWPISQSRSEPGRLRSAA